ncbi:flavodoxin [Methanobrevibacter sp.]
MSNVLVAYFSASGVTRNVAEKIANENGYDIFEIVPEEIYTPEDLDWTDKNSRSTIEMNDRQFRPPIVKSCDVSGYDTVVIGFPVWWYTAPSIINTFIESVDLSGKTIKAFCTSGGSGIDKCVNDLASAYPELDFAKGMRFTGDVSRAKEWIEE